MAEEMVRASGGFSRANLNAKYTEGYNEGVSDTKVGTAEKGDVLYGKTFTNNSAVGATGTMPNNGASNITLASRGQTAMIPRGYHNGSGVVSVSAPANSSKKVLTGSQTGDVDLSPYDFKYVNASAVYNAGVSDERNSFVNNGYVAANISSSEEWKKVQWFNTYRTAKTVYVAVTTARSVSSDHYANPSIKGMIDGVTVSEELIDTEQYQGTNIRMMIKMYRFNVPANKLFEIVSVPFE